VFRPRKSGSARRTTTVEVSWPEGPNGMMRFAGIGRDLVTDAASAGIVTDYIELQVDIDPGERRIVALRSSIADTASGIIGTRLGRELREAIDLGMRADLERGAVVIQLLDDLVGAWIVSGVALETWGVASPGPPLRTVRGDRKQMVGICLGFAPGSSGLAEDGGYAERVNVPDVARLSTVDDPLAWHEAPYGGEMSIRRARCIDVITGSEIEIDSMFQDSSTTPTGDRVGIHEYTVSAHANPASWELTAISATPRILPYGECPIAAHGVASLVGIQLPQLRDRVLTHLAGVKGCTHLNDAVRALFGVGQLADTVPRFG
jgi:hypothetical protein